MANIAAKFEKVSYEQFKKDLLDCDCIISTDISDNNNSWQAFGKQINSEADLDNLIREIYNNIKFPRRATKYSAGYDFFSPIDFKLFPASLSGVFNMFNVNSMGQTIKIPTGIRCKMNDDYVLMLYPRSGLGFKYRLQLNNTVDVIDADYYNAKNEGHIMTRITNDSNEGKTIQIAGGEGFMQGIFTQYALADEEEVTAEREGGFGSTTGK